MNTEAHSLKAHWRAKESSIEIREILILAIAAVILALPMLAYGPMTTGHDTYEHLNYSRHFSEQFWAGEWSPRWLLNMNHGLGSPSLFVYPPFASYVYALLYPASTLLHFNPFNVGELLALFASGVCAFLWGCSMAGRQVALAGAILYMLLPYHLALDFYRRNALSECWALVWMPLVLYFAAQVMAGKRRAVLGVAVAYAFLILSHFVSVLIFSLIPLAGAVMLSSRGQRIRPALRIGAGMALGAGIASFYLLPAISSAKYFPVLNLLRPPDVVVAANLIGLDDVIGFHADFVHWVFIAGLAMIMFIVFSGILVSFRERPDSRKRATFWLVMCAPPVFLMSRASLRLWTLSSRHFSWLLLRAIQYPWRFNIVLCLASVSLFALLLADLSTLSRLGRNAVLGLVSLLALSGVISYGRIWISYKTNVLVSAPKPLVDDDDGWFFSWSVPDLDQASALRASAGPRVRFLGATGTSEVRLWKARHIEFETNSPSGGWVMINQFYFPRWEATALGAVKPLAIKAALPEGLVAVDVPPGQRDIRLEIPVSPAEHIGRWISVFSILISGILLFATRPQSLPAV